MPSFERPLRIFAPPYFQHDPSSPSTLLSVTVPFSILVVSFFHKPSPQISLQLQNLCSFYKWNKVFTHCNIFCWPYCSTVRIELSLTAAYIWPLLPYLGPCCFILALITLLSLSSSYYDSYRLIRTLITSIWQIIALSWVLSCYLLATIAEPSWWILWL